MAHLTLSHSLLLLRAQTELRIDLLNAIILKRFI